MIPGQAERARRLKRMQRFATGLLVAMTALFVSAALLGRRYPALGVVEAFAEAAMIGGLADWFAVTALFRRPLGLPIPHTAIVPTRKNEIGRALARFIRDHFLTREAVQGRLERADLVARLGGWLRIEHNARLLSRDAGVALDWLMRAVDSADLRLAMRTSLREALDRVPVNVALSTVIDVLLAGDHAQKLIDQLVQFGREQLERNKAEIRRRIHDRSPWWLPRFVDEEIYDQLVAEFERILNDVGDDRHHPARVQFNERLRSLKASLATDPELIRKGQTLWDELVEHPAVRRYVQELWERMRGYLHASFTTPDSALRVGIEREIRSIGETFTRDADAARRLNRRLEDLVIYLVENYRDPLSEIVSDTIEQWDPDATSERIELHIGRDLQFIRVNGTLVGGLVGVGIYLLAAALPA
ncbi:MAG TPA: DUF445 domain-containing protein [Gammaproteobacteria bacterium]